MIKFKFIILSILLLTLNNSYSQNTVSHTPYPSPIPGAISIMACSPIPEGMTPTTQQYNDLVNCGFNLVTSVGSVDYFLKQYDLIKDLELKFMISSPNLRTDKRGEYIKNLTGNKHFGGWLFKDEPRFQELQELKNQFAALRKDSPNTLIYLNLIGSLMNTFTGNYKNYTQYLEYIQELMPSQIWSFDYYPIQTKNKKVTVVADQFFYDLECFRNVSRKYNKPFWSFCQSLAYNSKWANCPATTEPYLNFAAFSALAYGAQGIVYWTYGQRKSTATETYLSALVNLDGKKTPAWYAAQKVNANIKKYNDVFYQCNVKEVRHTGNTNFPNIQKISGGFGPFKRVKAGNTGILVSLIENNGKEYVVIVSHDVFNKQKITLELDTNKTLIDLTANNREYTWRNAINVTLDKGGYKIYQVGN